MISGVGAGEGLAAVRGNQSGAEGAAVAMPTLSREIEAWNLVDMRCCTGAAAAQGVESRWGEGAEGHAPQGVGNAAAGISI